MGTLNGPHSKCPKGFLKKEREQIETPEDIE